jgi:predicted nucleic acid-binding protein
VIVVDASVLIAYLDANDAHHAAAVELLEDAVPPLIVHTITAAEVLVVPVRRGIADEIWADLVAIGVEVDDTPIDPPQLAQLRAETGCRMPDCCVIASALNRGIAVATFDERLRKHTDSR